MDWCLTDPSLIMTLGRDNKVCVWNYKLPENENMVFERNVNDVGKEIKWSPKLPGIYSIST